MIYLQAQVQSWQDYPIQLLQEYAPRLVGAILALIVGFWVIGMLMRVVKKILSKRVEPMVLPLLKGVISISLKVALLISVATIVGIETTSFVAVLGAASLAIGLALQGSLANFAGGVLIVIFKPFKVGDWVLIQGHEGIVKEIQIFNTVVTTLDNRTLVLPNGLVSNGHVLNFFNLPERRIDMVFGVSYTDDLDKVKTVIREVLDKKEKILRGNPKYEYLIAVVDLADSSVNFEIRVWCKTEDYWDIYFALREDMKKAFDKNGINIPFPQRDVHLHQHK